MKKALTLYVAAIAGLSLLLVGRSEAVTSNCMRSLHKHALSDAINLVPAELKVILKEYEASMQRQVDAIHGMPPKSRMTYAASYKAIVDEMKTNDKKRAEYLSRMLAYITIYPYLKLSPIRMFDSCDENKVLSGVSVIYDGFNGKTEYEEFAEHSYTYEAGSELDKLRQFYSLTVNEMSDLWVSMWKEAGRDMSNLPVSQAIVRESTVQKTVPRHTAVKDTKQETTYSGGNSTGHEKDAEARRHMGNADMEAPGKSDRDLYEGKGQENYQRTAEERQKADEAEGEHGENIMCYPASRGFLRGGIFVSGEEFYRICKDRKTGKIISIDRM
jgi:hypothetical protein